MATANVGREENEQKIDGTTSILIVGRDGVGKSSLGNLLAGTEVFNICGAAEKTGTPKCQFTKVTCSESREYLIIDTPSFETWLDAAKTSDINEDLRKAEAKGPGLESVEIKAVNIVIFVMNGSDPRYRKDEINKFRKLQVLDHERMLPWLVVVTHSEAYEGENGLDTFISDCKADTTIWEFINDIKKRCILVDLKSSNHENSDPIREKVFGGIDHELISTPHIYPRLITHSYLRRLYHTYVHWCCR